MKSDLEKWIALTMASIAQGSVESSTCSLLKYVDFFFFQAEDGIRDLTVTGVQTCALPIWENGSMRQADLPSCFMGIMMYSPPSHWTPGFLRHSNQPFATVGFMREAWAITDRKSVV